MFQKKKKKSTSVDQNKIKVICDQACDRIEDLLDSFNLSYKMNGKFVSMSCPIHGGDNDGAINLYHIGDSYRGNWKCRTHHCEEIFKSSIVGFVRGILSHQKLNWNKNGDDAVPFQEAVEYITSFLNVSLKDIKINNNDKDKLRFVSNSKIFTENDTKPSGLSRSTVRKSLEIPSQYFLSRGFSKSILEKYDVGECRSQTKEMANRAVVPIYENDMKYMIGCTGRSIFEKCDKCKSYHDKSSNCPSNEESWKHSKWKHSYGFKTQESLYNFWYAKEFIQDSGTVIIVESPGNVWKLEENCIHNSVGIFGSNLTDKQKMLLDTSGAMNIIVIMDNDDAGNKGRLVIDSKCCRTYNIKHIHIQANDLADMTNDQIKELNLI